MAELGTFSLRLALFVAAFAVVVDILGVVYGKKPLMASARNATWACWVCLSTGMIALLIALAQSDFSVKYVAEHTSLALPVAYRLSALWAGAAGSLLLWLWLQVGMTALVFSRAAPGEDRFGACARTAANVVCCFFLVVLLFDKNVFEVSSLPPQDGSGLNAFLQHPAMVLHPPTLFIGYAAYVIPFAWSLALLAGPRTPTRPPFFFKAWKYMLIAWLFLAIGNVLGSWWAYEELGWGGFWSWDPVENSSLMPWLIGTALLHCFKRYRPLSAMGRWVVVLCLLTFSFCIFGTFLTRYGLVFSLHAFGEPGLGILFMVLLALIWVVVAVMSVVRMLASERRPEVKEVRGDGTIVVVNWLLVVLVAVILVGTLSPFFTSVYMKVAPSVPFLRDHIPQEAITLQSEYFTRITAPFGLGLLLLVGVCPHFFRSGIDFSWRTVGGVFAGVAALAVWYKKDVLAIPCFIICGYVALNIMVDFFVGALGRSGRSSSRGRLRWYGARFAHIGVVMMFFGIAGSEGYSNEKQAALAPGQSLTVGAYTINFRGISRSRGPNYQLTSAEISVEKEGRTFEMKPAISRYDNQKETSEVDIRRTLGGDFYVALTAVEKGGRLINLRVLVKPLINWLWLGGIVMAAGAIMVLLSARRGEKAA